MGLGTSPSARLRSLCDGRGMVVAAHRGTPVGSAAPNTALAALGALASGADMVEIDVSVSRDGVAHAFHDGLEREALGIEENLQELDSAAISRLRHWTDHAERPAPVPRLVDVLSCVRDAGGMVNLDRSWGHWPWLLDECAGLGMDDQILVKFPADQPGRLEELRSSVARVPVMTICRTKAEVHWFGQQAQELAGSGVDLCAVELIAPHRDHELAQPEAVAAAHDLGLLVFVNCEVLSVGPPLYAGWDDEMALREPGQPWQQLEEMGVDMVQTDWPWLARGWIDRGQIQ